MKRRYILNHRLSLINCKNIKISKKKKIKMRKENLEVVITGTRVGETHNYHMTLNVTRIYCSLSSPVNRSVNFLELLYLTSTWYISSPYIYIHVPHTRAHMSRAVSVNLTDQSKWPRPSIEDIANLSRAKKKTGHLMRHSLILVCCGFEFPFRSSVGPISNFFFCVEG